MLVTKCVVTVQRFLAPFKESWAEKVHRNSHVQTKKMAHKNTTRDMHVSGYKVL